MYQECTLWTAPNCPKIRKMTMTAQFSKITSTSIFFYPVLFLLWSLVTVPSSMSISSLVLEFWQFSFLRDWPEIWKSQTSPSKFCPISGDWGELSIPNWQQMSVIERYWMLQNSRVTALTVFELFNENQLGEGVKLSPTQIRVNWDMDFQNKDINDKLKYWMNDYWIYLIILFPIKFLNLII